MKTLLFIPTMLIIGLPGMLDAQVSQSQKDNGSILSPTNKISYDKESRRNPKSQVVSNVNDKTPEVSEKVNLIDKQIAELLKLRSGLTNEGSSSFANVKSGNAAKDLLIVQIDEYFDKKIESEELNRKYTALRKEANQKNEPEKIKLLKKANDVYSAYEIKEIALSNMLSQINYAKFSENKTTIKTLLIEYKGGAIYVKMVNKLTDEADYAMRMAIEIKEEANAQPNNSAKLGNYSNAEEKEVVALAKQGEAINILEKTAFVNMKTLGEGLAFINAGNVFDK